MSQLICTSTRTSTRASALKHLFPAEILTKIYEYDNTYHTAMTEILTGYEFVQVHWGVWMNQFRACISNIEPSFHRKCEFLIEYMMDDAPYLSFPRNICVYCPSKLLFYSNKQEDVIRAVHLLHSIPKILPHYFDIVFEYGAGEIYKFCGFVLTKQEYYSRYINVEEDNHVTEECVYDNCEFYIIKNIQVYSYHDYE
jgi:hypothetical protein